jgi:hypothetical protein
MPNANYSIFIILCLAACCLEVDVHGCLTRVVHVLRLNPLNTLDEPCIKTTPHPPVRLPPCSFYFEWLSEGSAPLCLNKEPVMKSFPGRLFGNLRKKQIFLPFGGNFFLLKCLIRLDRSSIVILNMLFPGPYAQTLQVL